MAVTTDKNTFLTLFENGDSVLIKLNPIDKITQLNIVTLEFCLYNVITDTENTIPPDAQVDYQVMINKEPFHPINDLPLMLDPGKTYFFEIKIRLVLHNGVIIPENNVIKIKEICLMADRNINAC